MSSLKKIDQITQYKLTNAIQKAASVAAASGKDPSSVLAGELDKAHLPNHLNKVATQAFNRRLSVMQLSARTDQTKADTFPIADLSAVDKARGVQTIQKTASAMSDGEFRIDFSKASMKKSAKYKAPKASKKELTVGQFMHKLQAAIDHDTNVLHDMHYNILQQQTNLKDLKKRAYTALQGNTKVCKQLTAKYGDAFVETFNKLPEENLQKFASFVVLPDSKEVKLAQSTMQKAGSTMIKSAVYEAMAHIQKQALKVAAKVESLVKQARLDGLIKQGAGWSVAKSVIAEGLGVPIKKTLESAGQLGSSFKDSVLNANSLMSAQVSANPQSAITGAIIATDKQDEQRVALADVLADKGTKKFPFRQIEAAVHSAVSENPQFLSPRYREHLKADVRNRLLSGGTNQAMQAATATMLKALADADTRNSAISAHQRVRNMQKVKGIDKDLASLTKIIPDLDLTKLTGDLDKLIAQQPSIQDAIASDSKQLYDKLTSGHQKQIEQRQQRLNQLQQRYNQMQKRLSTKRDAYVKARAASVGRQQAVNPSRAGAVPVTPGRLRQINKMTDQQYLNDLKQHDPQAYVYALVVGKNQAQAQMRSALSNMNQAAINRIINQAQLYTASK